jgi:hypothetical protein
MKVDLQDSYITFTMMSITNFNLCNFLHLAFTQQNYLRAENENLSGTLQQLAKNFCQDLIRQLEQKQRGSYGKYGLVTSLSNELLKYFCDGNRRTGNTAYEGNASQI